MFLKTKPQSFEAHSNLGVALAAQGLFADAITEYKSALKIVPSNPGISFNLALAYYKTGDLPLAASELSALRALIGDEPRVMLLLADSWLQMGENDRVIRLLIPAAEKTPEDLGVAYVLGTALMRTNKVYEGQRYLDKILRNGDSAEARLLMGTSKVVAADFAGALVEFQRKIESCYPRTRALQPGFEVRPVGKVFDGVETKCATVVATAGYGDRFSNARPAGEVHAMDRPAGRFTHRGLSG